MQKNCAVCGILFGGRRHNAKVCSSTCRLTFKCDYRKDRYKHFPEREHLYVANNRDRINRYRSLWAAKNPDRVRAAQERYRNKHRKGLERNCRICEVSLAGTRWSVQYCDSAVCQKRGRWESARRYLEKNGERIRAQERERRKRDPEYFREKNRGHRQKKSPEEWREYNRAWRAKNPGKAAAAVRKWKQKDPEHVRKLGRESHWRNRDKLNQKCRLYRQKNRELVNIKASESNERMQSAYAALKDLGIVTKKKDRKQVEMRAAVRAAKELGLL